MGRPFEPTVRLPLYGDPLYWVSAGLGSNVSMWLGAPFMNKNTQCLAFAGKCWGLAASGLTVAAAASRERRSASARLANPPPAWKSKFLRVRLIGINKLVQIENHAAHLFERFAL